MKAAKQPRQVKPAAAKPDKAVEGATPRMSPERVSVVLGLLSVLAFFGAYGLCLWKWIDVGLIYHGSGQVQDFPSFYWGWEFARDFRTHPGGAIEYGAALLAQALYFSWFGALVLTAQAGVIYATLADCLGKLRLQSLRLLALVPPILALSIYSKYRHYSVPVSSFGVGCIATWIWYQVKVHHGPARVSLALVLVVLLCVTAPSALLVFVPALLAREILAPTPGLWIALLSAISAVVPPIVGAILFGFGLNESYAKLLPMPWDPIVWKMAGIKAVIALYCFPTIFWLLVTVWEIRRRRKQRVSESPGASSSASSIARSVRNASSVAAIFLPVIVVSLTLNPEVRALMKMDFYAWNGRWAEVLAASAKANHGSRVVAAAVAQASYHTGALLNVLPHLQTPADLLLSRDKQNTHWKQSDLYYDLGYVNMALHHLIESVEFYGERPVLLQRLALVNLALGNVSTAKVYLESLARAPFQGEWANDYLQHLQVDPSLANDAEVARLRRSMVQADSVVSLSPDEELLMLLDANRQNRMAFEYLMTYYLLTKNFNGFVRNISRANTFSGVTISPMWDEALVLAERLAGRPLRIPGHMISQEAVSRVDGVSRAVKEAGDNAVVARHKLEPQFGQTYTFYWWFHE